MVGHKVAKVEANGKHLLVRFDSGHVLHTHLRMTGSWHVYSAGEKWQRPASQARVTLACGGRVAVCFTAPVVELLPPGAEANHPSLSGLGPDILAEPLQARRRIGFLSGTTGLYGRLSARENVEYFGRLHGLAPQRLRRRCDALFEQLEMHEFAHKRADSLSSGMKQKCAIARTVIHEPSILILDEPTTGLDVMSAKIVLDFVASYKALRIPVILSTHHLHEVDKLCDRVCIVNHGASIFQGTVEQLRHLGGGGDLYDAFVHVIHHGA